MGGVVAHVILDLGLLWLWELGLFLGLFFNIYLNAAALNFHLCYIFNIFNTIT